MSMLLSGDNGCEFELALVEDRFPQIQDDFDDSNFVTLTFRVGTPDESWEETAPCLNLYEIQNLADWLEAAGRAEPDLSTIELLEPELWFRIVKQNGTRVLLRIGFHLDRRPDEFAVDAPTDEANWVDIKIDREQLITAAVELREDLERVSTPHTDGEEGDDASGMQGVPDDELNLISGEGISPDELSDEDRYR